MFEEFCNTRNTRKTHPEGALDLGAVDRPVHELGWDPIVLSKPRRAAASSPARFTLERTLPSDPITSWWSVAPFIFARFSVFFSVKGGVATF